MRYYGVMLIKLAQKIQ